MTRVISPEQAAAEQSWHPASALSWVLVLSPVPVARISPWSCSAHRDAQPTAAGRTGVAVPWAAGLYGAAPRSGGFLAQG